MLRSTMMSLSSYTSYVQWMVWKYQVGINQDHGEHDQLYVWHHFQNASIQGCQICHKEDPQQVDSENKDMEESISIKVNMFNYMWGTIFKMPAFGNPKFVKKKTQSRWTVRTRSTAHHYGEPAVHHYGEPAIHHYDEPSHSTLNLNMYYVQ